MKKEKTVNALLKELPTYTNKYLPEIYLNETSKNVRVDYPGLVHSKLATINYIYN